MNSCDSESIEILRETVAIANYPVMQCDKGLVGIAPPCQKGYESCSVAVSPVAYGTGWKSKAKNSHRHRLVEDVALSTLVGSDHTGLMEIQVFKQAPNKYDIDIVFGGARSGEKKYSVKEHIFFCAPEAAGIPSVSVPSCATSHHLARRPDETIRVSPISNLYGTGCVGSIRAERISFVPEYLAQVRPVAKCGGRWAMVDDDRFTLLSGEWIEVRGERFCNLGYWILTTAFESAADTQDNVTAMMSNVRNFKRQGLSIGSDVTETIEEKGREGYF